VRAGRNDANGGWQDSDLDVPAPPFDRNPSAWSQRVPVSVLAALGALIAAYMALYQWDRIGGVWDPVFGAGSESVLDSQVASRLDRWLRVPDAAFGAWGYLSEAVLGLAGSTRRWQFRPWMVVLFGIDVIPLGGASAVLVVLQGFVVGSWCLPCLVTAAISIALIFFAWDEVWASVAFLYRVWKRTRSARVVWRTFWGVGSPEAAAVALERS